MSCGKPHETDCADALDRLYEYIDGELTPEVKHKIRVHLDECAPCLDQADVERAVKALVSRSCREGAPEGLRQRVLARLDSARQQAGEA
ncbi:mycothiol system anti-sigma-R factor [Aquipuribacter nitratireducens]|uniref:Mycothiol system anti-sigma-R factor n=1 Tax=Aquipuribacter nitratireducens TaxID=650104 RepID=A0ABW0GL13_9MICO